MAVSSRRISITSMTIEVKLHWWNCEYIYFIFLNYFFKNIKKKRCVCYQSGSDRLAGIGLRPLNLGVLLWFLLLGLFLELSSCSSIPSN